jgi:hypothetical protein
LGTLVLPNPLLAAAAAPCYSKYRGTFERVFGMAGLSDRTIEIPQSVLVTAQSLDDLEDWIEGNDAQSLSEVRRIRNEEGLAGAGKDISEVLKRWPIE